MKPARNIKVAPNPKTLSFLKLLHAYLQQSKSELNYIEARRANDKIAELAELEFHRQMRSMDEEQRLELAKLEQI